MKFGLGFGLNRNNFLGGAIDARIQQAINANATMLLMGDLANGSSPGNNTDPTNVWVDKSGVGNNASAVNFAWTTASGWDNVVVPSGAEAMLKGDGVDDYLTIPNHASLDPTGTEDFAICLIFKTPSSLATDYIYSKGLNSEATQQIGLLLRSTGSVSLYLNGDNITIVSPSTLVASTVYSLTVKRIGGVLKTIVNEVQTFNSANSTSLISQPYIRAFARSNSLDGLSQTLFFGGFMGALAFFYNGATGLNETDVDNACALLKAPYF